MSFNFNLTSSVNVQNTLILRKKCFEWKRALEFAHSQNKMINFSIDMDLNSLYHLNKWLKE
jgi:hypothetical protein